MLQEINLCNVASVLFELPGGEWNPMTDSLYITNCLLSGWHNTGTPRSPFSGLTSNSYANELVDNYILPRSGRSTILSFDDDSPEDREEAKKAMTIFGDMLVAWLYNSSKKYSPIIAKFTAQENNLLNKIATSVETSSRFNDTPQDTTTPDDDAYLTTYGKDYSISESDGATIMARLAEIRDQFSDVYESWLNEFRRAFKIL